MSSQIKQRRKGNTKKNGKNTSDLNDTQEPGNSTKKQGEESVKEYLDLRKDDTNSQANEEYRQMYDFDDNIFDRYYSINKDDLSHLFLQTDSTSVKFNPDE